MTNDTVPVTVNLPSSLVAEIRELLDARGTSMDDVVRLHFRSMLRTNHVRATMDLDDKMKFGKHHGSTLRQVILADPTYIRWLADQLERPLNISPEAVAELERVEAVGNKVAHLQLVKDE